MTKRLLIDAQHPEEMRVTIANERQIMEYDFFTSAKQQVKGNIYLAKITRVEPSLQAAFVEYGGGKQGFLPFAEIHADYYQIPVSDRKKLLEEAERDDDDQTEDFSAHGAGVDATLNQRGEETGSEDSLADPAGADVEDPSDSEVRFEAGLPALEAIPEQHFSEPDDEAPAPQGEAPEEAPAAQPQHRFAFTASEVVAQDTIENEELSERLAAESAAAPERPEAAAPENIDTLPSEDEDSRPKRNNFYRRYKIQEVIKRGQIVLVQVIKEERGNKGVSLTTYLSLAGRYCVLMPNSPKDGGISRKISDGDIRKRLKEMLAELKLARGMSVIIRTAGVDRTRAEIRRDFDYLVKLWNKIRETTLSSTAPALIYEESDLIKRAIRDLYTNDIEEVMVEGDAAYKTARDFMKMLLPSHTPRVKHYQENMPIFYAYGIEEQLLSMHDPVVKLRSGGYIVINPTEALISIDVNSGRSTGERNIEETATKTNLEAAAEIARQLRLRDLAGLIVIDFIDMMESRNRRNVERALKDALKSDRAKIQLGRISPFGLLEMSRQRMRPSISETNMTPCPHCEGRGHVRSNESMSIQIVRSLEKEAANGNCQGLKLSVPEHIALHLLNSARLLLSQIEERYGVQVQVIIDHDLSASAFSIEKVRRGQRAEGDREGGRERGGRDRDKDRGRSRPRREREEQPSISAEPAPEETPAEEGENAADENSAVTGENGDRARRRRGRRGGRNRNRNGRERSEAAPSEENGEAAEAAPPAENGEEGEAPAARPPRERQPRHRREPGEGRESRGSRGGRRRWRDDAENVENAPAPVERSAAPAAHDSPAESLPPFTRSPVVEPLPAKREAAAGHHGAEPPSVTHRPEGAPPRKGWWQRIIELD